MDFCGIKIDPRPRLGGFYLRLKTKRSVETDQEAVDPDVRSARRLRSRFARFLA